MGTRLAASSLQDSITCPKCGAFIPITETLRQQLTEQARAELQRDFVDRQQALANRQKDLDAKELQLQNAEIEIEDRVVRLVANERAKLRSEALQKAREEVSLELQELRVADQEKGNKLREAQEAELSLRKEKRQLESAKQELELEVARKLDHEREDIREKALKDAAEDHRLKDSEKDAKLAEALKVNEELRRKLEQGSQQAQGEVLELELEHALRDAFAIDEILEVPKGVRGADVLQKVNNRAGLASGSIIWEAKNAKNWSDGWIAKLKDDQRVSKSDVAVIVSEALPKGLETFGFKDGVWVTNRRFILPLAEALRQGLIEIAQARRAVAGKNEVVEAIFRYATGPEFRHRVETIARNFVEMKDDLEQERRVTIRRWAKRAKQLDLIIVNTSEMYGELQGLIGKSMTPVTALEAAEGDTAETETVDLAAIADVS